MAVAVRTVDKTEVQRLLLAAYGPQPVKQPDGSTLQLCWQGRIHRALMLLNAATLAGDVAKVAQLQQGLATLEAAATQAQSAATRAQEAYAQAHGEWLAIAACTCEGCKVGATYHALGAAMGNARTQLWDLLMPQGDAMPALVQLVTTIEHKESRVKLWEVLKNLSDNLQAFATASQALGETPKWENIWP